MYPGLLDGLQPNCTFVDLWTTASDVFDCGLLVHYFSGRAPGGPPLGRWVPAIDGHKEPSNCAAWDATFYNYLDPTNAEPLQRSTPSLVYHPETNPGGVRCTIADYMKSIFGLRPPSQWTEPEKKIGRGFANLPWGNEGVQYGLVALRSGADHARRVRRPQPEDRRPHDRREASGRAHRGRREHGVDRVPQRRGDGRQVGRGHADHRPAGLQRERRDPHQRQLGEAARPPGPRPTATTTTRSPGRGTTASRSWASGRRWTSSSSRSC